MSPHVDPAALLAAAGRDRHAMLAHLRGCASCRAEAAAYDPTILFALLALTPVPPALLDDLSKQVARRAGSDHPTFGVLAGSVAWPRRAAAAAAFVLTLLCGWAMLDEGPAPPRPVSLSSSSRRADVDVESGRGVSQVIDLTVGETQIVMVYNGDLKL